MHTIYIRTWKVDATGVFESAVSSKWPRGVLGAGAAPEKGTGECQTSTLHHQAGSTETTSEEHQYDFQEVGIY